MICIKIKNITIHFFIVFNQIINNYINHINSEVIKPENDIFEKFFYNYIILIHWLIVKLNIVIIKIIKYIFNQSKNTIVKIYDYLNKK